jgi:uncharacterized protein (DUF2236 family)
MAVESVSSRELEGLLDERRRSVKEDDRGLFGPESASWLVNRESALFLAAGRAALLQLSHPWVATAIAQHSRTLDDPIGRFHNTFRVIFTMIFGSTEQAFAAARHLHALHQRIRGDLPDEVGRFPRGTPYEANHVAALRWVYATLIDSALIAYELLLPALNASQREQYLKESLVMASLFGIPPEHLPQNWHDFGLYMQAMLQSDTLGVSAATLRLAQRLQAGAGLLIPPPFWYQALTIRLLPERLRRDFQLPCGEREQNAAARAVAWLRPIYLRLPAAIRFVGPYNEATHRLMGKGPGLAVRLSNRLWTGRPALLSSPE